MATDELTDDAPRGLTAPRVFAVRLWKEELDGGSGYRGSVRDVVTDAYRGFRDWSDLVAFMVARIEHDDARAQSRREEA